jgi:hypothetical protein
VYLRQDREIAQPTLLLLLLLLLLLRLQRHACGRFIEYPQHFPQRLRF